MLLPAPRAGEVVLEHSARAVLADVEERASASDAEEGEALMRGMERGADTQPALPGPST